MNMETSRRESTLVYAIKGTQVLTVPEELRGRVRVNIIVRQELTDKEIEFFQNYPIKEWECWEVVGAVVGFSGDGSLRLSCPKYDKCITWVRNANRIYGVSDYGPIRGNYRLCRNCGKIAGQCKVVNDSTNEDFLKHDNVTHLVSYCCPCRHVWTIECSNGRANGRTRAKNKTPVERFKAKYTNHRHKNSKRKTFCPQYAS
jgi:hypothetical protein